MKHKASRSKAVFRTVCSLPALALFAVFGLYPFGQAIVMAFTDWSGISDSYSFVGLDNFRTMLNDDYIWIGLKNNLFLLIVVPAVTLTLSLFFAAMLTRNKLREGAFYRTVFFFPNVLSVVVISVLWSFIYHPTFGLVNSLLERIGLGHWAHAWLGDNETVMWALAVPMVWGSIGYYMIIYIASMEGIPPDLYEAAVIDGANELQQFTKITLPLIWDIVRITIVLFLLSVFNGSFALVKIMTDGAPDHASELLTTYMYRQGFSNGNYGYAMAIGMFMLVLTITLALISERLTKKESVQF
ncbi:carbohydrate ABC transporter permease [Paenibacillus contaminans]|uniref:Sugar ABC transporter permease n=1 Tax=Paenibacillus contaminans TaxID=450362 RepID=A0A329MSW5_9BACL|nr:sugar ABC transporter permease [Paenibacillus contaminans]RAV21047.1 sugar ABC transporter permease [Paenibacillus contaminans]